MADNNIDADVEQLKNNFERVGQSYEEHIKMLDASLAAGKKSASDISSTMSAVKKSFNDGALTAEELSEELVKLRNQIKNTKDRDKIQALLNEKEELEQRNARNKASKALTETFAGLGGVVLGGVAKSFANVGKAALSGGDSFAVAGEMMNAGVDLINTANQGGANALKTFGTATAGAGGNIGKFGRVAAIAGEGLGMLSESVSGLAKAGIGFMITQTKELISGFQTMSAVGAVYAGGMQQMIGISAYSGMTLSQFSKSVANNSDLLLKSGIGIAEGSKRMARAMNAGGESARNGMFALGLGMEEQAEVYAATIASMTGPLGKLHASDEEVAVKTQEYARSLKLISDLTGKSAKEQRASADAATNSLRMQQELAKMAPEVREQFRLVLGGMEAEGQVALQQRIAFGGAVRDKTLNILETASPALRALNEERFILQKQGKLTADADQQLRAKYAKQINQQLADQTALGAAAQAAGSSLGEVSARGGALMRSNQEMIDVNVERRAAEIKAAQDAGKTGEGGEEVAAMIRQQGMALGMQKIATDNLDKFGTALDETYKAAMLAVGALSKLASAAGNNPLAALTTSLTPLIAAAVGAAAMSGFGGKGAGAGAASPGSPGGKFGKFVKSSVGAVAGFATTAAARYASESGYNKTGAGLDIAGSALTGASIGSLLGPIGTAIGGTLGAAYGIYENRDTLFGSNESTTAPKPVTNPNKQSVVDQQNKLNNSAALQAELHKKAMEKPSASANPAEQQQIRLLQSILSTMEQNTKLTSGILRSI